MKHILFIAADADSLINFRLPLIKKILSRGHLVSVASPINKSSKFLQKELQDIGVSFHIFKVSRTGLNLFKNFKSLLEIYKIIKITNPNIIISYMAKPVIYTGLVLKIFKKISYYPMITGIGYGLYEKKSFKHMILKLLIKNLYYFSLKSAKKIIFQNADDQTLFRKFKIIDKYKISEIVNGSGIDLKAYPFSKLPKKPIFLMVARLLIDKGVREYVEAAKIVRLQYPNVIFQLAGNLDENPASIHLKELEKWIHQGDILYLGKCKSVHLILQNCKFFVLPSYREGTPRSTLEALSTGRPVITTNVPGCRETVTHGKNGLIIPVKDTLALSKAMIKLINTKDEQIKKMARESFNIAKDKYEVSKVNQKMIQIMNL